MAESTLRENRRGATHQNATIVNQARMRVLVQEPFYQHDHLGPGAPLREITGEGDGDGYYDWAGRRLFTIDGEPDPMCPGAYRYQHNPDCCDLEAPDSDPRSPRYEPMHLRHKPGDTWIIDSNRPYDPFDSGPFGSPGWYKDERTGRHRRDETPDPLAAEGWVAPKGAWFPGTADWPEPEPPQDDQGRAAEQLRRGDSDDRGGGDGRGGSGRGGRGVEEFRLRDSGERGGSDRPPPWGSRGRPVPSEPDEPEEPQRPWGARTGRPSPTPGTDAHPARRPWDRCEPGNRGPGDAGWISGYGGRQSREDSSGESESEGERRSAADTTGEFRFSAFDRFIANSAQLRAAHFAPQKPYLRERAVWVLRWLLWVFAIGLAPMPAPLHPYQHRPGSPAVQPIPTQPVPSTRESESRPEQAESIRPGADQHRDDQSQTERPQPAAADPSRGPSADSEHRPGAEPTYRPGAAIAAAVAGARVARKAIAARSTRTSEDLAAAVRESVNRTELGRNESAWNIAARAGDAHWRTQPSQERPRPTPRPTGDHVNRSFARPAPRRAYMTAWEQAFDTGHTIILATGTAFGAAA
jgi:hypothetical protein